jgi:hypothetical protein
MSLNLFLFLFCYLQQESSGTVAVVLQEAIFFF